MLISLIFYGVFFRWYNDLIWVREVYLFVEGFEGMILDLGNLGSMVFGIGSMC